MCTHLHTHLLTHHLAASYSFRVSASFSRKPSCQLLPSPRAQLVPPIIPLTAPGTFPKRSLCTTVILYFSVFVSSWSLPLAHKLRESRSEPGACTVLSEGTCPGQPVPEPDTDLKAQALPPAVSSINHHVVHLPFSIPKAPGTQRGQRLGLWEEPGKKSQEGCQSDPLGYQQPPLPPPGSLSSQGLLNTRDTFILFLTKGPLGPIAASHHPEGSVGQ